MFGVIQAPTRSKAGSSDLTPPVNLAVSTRHFLLTFYMRATESYGVPSAVRRKISLEGFYDAAQRSYH